MTELDGLAQGIDTALGWAPNWFAALVVFATAFAAALLVHGLAQRVLTRLVQDRSLFLRSLVQRTRRPRRLLVLLLAAAAANRVAPLSEEARAAVGHLILAGMIVLICLAARTAMTIWSTLHLRRFKLDSEDNLLARKHVTQIRILRRVADTLIVVLGIGAILMTFEGVRQYGVSLLASAGAASLVVGLALQPLLKNLFAGIQLALAQPIRIDDAVLVEGEWGTVEEITSTYVVVKIWDWRRLIVPLGYFIEKPFQNWTREQASLIGSVILHLDYRAKIDAIRGEVERLLGATQLWDGRVMNVQVVDASEATIEVRILATAKNAPTAWDLRCYLREGVVAFLAREHPEALPLGRLSLAAGEGAPSTAAGPQPA